MPRYVTTLRACYDAADDVEAIFIADKIRENGQQDLTDDDEENESTLEVTQVTSNQLDISPEELLVQLRRARNLLIKTRIRDCYQLAKELDQQIFALANRSEPDFAMAGYSYGNFMDLTEAILREGKMPDV